MLAPLAGVQVVITEFEASALLRRLTSR